MLGCPAIKEKRQPFLFNRFGNRFRENDLHF